MLKLMHGDCLEKMAEIESGSVDMILTDPPYGTVKGIGSGGVSHGMKGRTEWDVAIDHGGMLSECNRVLRVNGVLVLFSQDPYTAKLMTETHGNLPFSYRLTWLKDHFANSLIAKKAPVNYTEDIVVFFKKYDTLAQHPLREYALKIKARINYSRSRLFKELGHGGAQHFLEGNKESTQFALCTEKTYGELIDLYAIDQIEDFISFDTLYKIDRRFARRFNLPKGKKYKSNVLDYKKDYTGYHSTQKPVALMVDLVKMYTDEEDTILDFTMGSGTTGVAAMNLHRGFIGIEKGFKHFTTAALRIVEACSLKNA